MDYRIKSFIKARRCVETARRRCVFKIYNVTRLKIFAPQRSFMEVSQHVLFPKENARKLILFCAIVWYPLPKLKRAILSRIPLLKDATSETSF